MEHQLNINNITITVVYEWIDVGSYSGYYWITKNVLPEYGTKLIAKTINELELEIRSVINHD